MFWNRWFIWFKEKVCDLGFVKDMICNINLNEYLFDYVFVEGNLLLMGNC